MLAPLLLLQLTSWTLCVSAFFPYTPSWRKDQVEYSVAAETQRRTVGQTAEDSLAFPLKQKHSQDNESPATRAAKQAAWLRTKFKHTRSRGPTGVIMDKRTNTYDIMEATDPGQPMTTGVDQDGTDYSYFIAAKLGSKGKQMYLLLDTGAGSSWVMGSNCKDAPCTQHNTFGSDDSATFVNQDRSFSISYGSGTVRGNLASDTFNIAGVSVQYTFGVALQTSDDFSHFAFDGILGMSMSQGASDNFLKTLVDGKKLDKNLFGVSLNRASDGTNHGEIKFGATNPDKYTGDISYTPVGSQEGDWAIQIDDMAYDGKKAQVGGVLSYIDTGTSFVFGPPALVKKFHATIPGSASGDGLTYTVPCDSSKTLAFTFSGVDYKLSPADWISPKDSSGKCTSNIYGHEVVQGAWLLGDTFLKNVYTVFDRDQKRVGFAAAASSGQSSPSQTTVGPSTGTSSSFTTDASHQSKGPALGLGGHETSTSSSGNAPKPTQSSKSGAADLLSRQNAKLSAIIFAIALVVVAA